METPKQTYRPGDAPIAPPPSGEHEMPSPPDPGEPVATRPAAFGSDFWRKDRVGVGDKQVNPMQLTMVIGVVVLAALWFFSRPSATPAATTAAPPTTAPTPTTRQVPTTTAARPSTSVATPMTPTPAPAATPPPSTAAPVAPTCHSSPADEQTVSGLLKDLGRNVDTSPASGWRLVSAPVTGGSAVAYSKEGFGYAFFVASDPALHRGAGRWDNIYADNGMALTITPLPRVPRTTNVSTLSALGDCF